MKILWLFSKIKTNIAIWRKNSNFWNLIIFLIKILWLIFWNIAIWQKKCNFDNFTIFLVKIIWKFRKIWINKCDLTEKMQLIEFDNFSREMLFQNQLISWAFRECSNLFFSIFTKNSQFYSVLSVQLTWQRSALVYSYSRNRRWNKIAPAYKKPG